MHGERDRSRNIEIRPTCPSRFLPSAPPPTLCCVHGKWIMSSIGRPVISACRMRGNGEGPRFSARAAIEAIERGSFASREFSFSSHPGPSALPTPRR